MKLLKKLFSTQPVNVKGHTTCALAEEESALLEECKLFLATGKTTEALQKKIIHYKTDDPRLSDYEVVELILDHNERLHNK